MSLATIAVPAAMASRSTIPKDSRPVAGEQYTSAVLNSASRSSSETRPRNSTPPSLRVARYRRASLSWGPPPAHPGPPPGDPPPGGAHRAGADLVRGREPAERVEGRDVHAVGQPEHD